MPAPSSTAPVSTWSALPWPARPRDYVTEVDRASEEVIVEVLRTAYPDHAVLGEEFGLQGPEQAEFQWIIDPLDGTTNYIHGLPNYAVSIALLHRRQVTQAVVYDPSRNELFTASRGSGTFLNDRRVRVSGRIRYHDALLGAHWPHSTDPDQGSGRFRAMAEGSASVRRLGSTVLDLAYVACGRLDGFAAWASSPGTWPPAACWCWKPAACLPTSTASRAGWTPATCWRARPRSSPTCSPRCSPVRLDAPYAG